MVKEIIVDIGLLQTRVAVLEDGEPAEIFIEGSRPQRLVGNIYRGIVREVLPGIQAAFIDIGVEKNAYLYVSEAVPGGKSGTDRSETSLDGAKVHKPRIEQIIKPGREITVQVIKEPVEGKGARVTTNITLPGKYAVLVCNNSLANVSAKIKNDSERERLKNIASKFCGEGSGIIIRTASEGVKDSEIENEILMLLRLRDSIFKKESKGKVPRILHQETGLHVKIAREYLNKDVKGFVINDRDRYNELLDYLDKVSPDLKNKIKLFHQEYDLFEYYRIEPAIREALSRKVWLKCGGYLVFDETEALTVIDVNTGKFTGKREQENTILQTNLEAAAVIARQIRLRNIEGIILVDFIDMKEESHKDKVVSFLKEAVRADRNKVIVEGITKLGLVEMTRKKVRGTLRETITKPCPVCGGTGRLIQQPGQRGSI
ncbi:MAG TPA: ribonuclease E/G [Ruminiclostridium sp.]|jgi:ribonuclease G|nr:Rne/Rng family ribonuclease [Clostridiaceae bacterium]HAA26105.1 ribonuclease E/G [Ruminiclostridium sp.]